jgi:hypothetical protein
MYTFDLHLFFFDAHDSQVQSFDGVTDFLCIPFIAWVFCLRIFLFFFNIYFAFFIVYSFIHTCIHCLGHLSPWALLTPSFSLPSPCFQAEPVLPSSLTLLKKRHKL